MHYKIQDTFFKIDSQALYVNNQRHDLKHTTLKALILFLKSNGKIVSKDDLLDYIWEDVIVSDASAFKQVQLIRKLFIEIGLPKDIIENIYGKGYKINYDIKSLSKDTNETSQLKLPQQTYKNYLFLSATVLLVIAAFYFYSQSTKKEDFLNLDKRESMVSLMNNDWEKGLQHINTILEEDKKRLSENDMAFLYEKKGLSQYHLQDYKLSIETYKEALKRYEKLDNKEHIGQLHLNIAGSHSLLANSGDYYEVQQFHINAAIGLFEELNKQEKMIDAQMTLAQFYKKNNKIPDAIKIYKKTIIDARSIGDKTGEMIANNNLAATYMILNDYDKAIELGQDGLAMTLEIGLGRYIASSYSFLSDLYQHEYRSVEAMDMIEQAIKYQLASNEYSYLSSKLITLDYLLIQTYQHEKATELLNLSEDYARSLEIKSGISIISLYKGINAARKSNWDEAEQQLSKALEHSQRINFKYKQPLNMAYLALAHYFNNNYLQAIEPAMTVFNNTKSDPQAKAIAALALSYTYTLMEKKELADKWFLESQDSLNPKWLFEQKLFLLLKLERQVENNSIFISETENEILNLSNKMSALAKKAQVDETIFLDLKFQISNKITSIETQSNTNQ